MWSVTAISLNSRSSPVISRSGYEALNNRELLGLIEKYASVKALIAGHHHKGGFAVYKHIPAITLEGMVETADKNTYGIIELYANKMILKGRGRLTSRTLSFNKLIWKK
ncbi:hypothetical protein D9M68_608230 [compost metagenome]